jgi:O-antigen/teichoic acid export membrane protein
MSLRDSAFSALRWTTVSTLGKTALQFLQIVVLARILTPGDFGLMAIVMAVVAFLQGLADLGVSNAIIHHADVNERELCSLYWLNMGAAATLAALVCLLSPVIAAFYHDVRLENLLMLASLSLLINAASQQLRVRAERSLRFNQLAIIELLAAVGGFIAAALMAWWSRQAIALVVGLLVSSVILTTASWLTLAQGWRPSMHFLWADTQRFLRFGGYSTMSNLISTLSSQADVVIGGKLLHSMELGGYSMARDLSLRLASIVNPVVTRVGLPLMAQDHTNKVFVRDVYGRTLAAISALNFPLYLGVAAFAPELMVTLFGEKWLPSAGLLRILALWGMVRCLMNPVGSLLYACGHADAAFRWNLILVCLSLPLYFVAAHWGGWGLAVSQLFFMLSVFGPCWRWLVFPDTGMTWRSYLALMVRPFALSAVSVAAAYLAAQPLSSPLSRLVVAVLVALVCYGCLSYRFNRPWIDAMRQLLGLR